MPTATEVLRREHEGITKVLDVLEAAADRLERGQNVPERVLDGMIEFMRVFVDRCHHGKEESALFPVLESRGIPRQGPIGVMLSDHEAGRSLARALDEAIQGIKKGEPLAGRRFSQVARQYSAHLRSHIDKENNVLFVMAENLLAPEEQSRLAEDFERIELERIGVGEHERLHRLIGEMQQVFAASSGTSRP
jgi:hemerythrin-like domain-containing protein